MIELSEVSDYPLSIFVTRMQSPYGIVELSGDRLVAFKEKPMLDYYINAGIYFAKITTENNQTQTVKLIKQ